MRCAAISPLLCMLATACAPDAGTEVVLRRVAWEPRWAMDAPQQFKVSRIDPDGSEHMLEHVANAAVAWGDDVLLVSPDRTMWRVAADGSRTWFDRNVAGAPAVFRDHVAWVTRSSVQRTVEVKVHWGGTTRVVAHDLYAANGLRFTPDGEHLLVMGAGQGGVAGLYVTRVDTDTLQCLTNCTLRAGRPWKNFVPLPTHADELVFSEELARWSVRGQAYAVVWTGEDAPAVPPRSPPLIHRRPPSHQTEVPPASGYGTLRVPFECTGGGWSCLLGVGYADQDASSNVQDWNCGDQTYNGHIGTDFVMEAGHPVTASADGTVYYVVDGYFDECTGCNPSGDCSFESGNWITVDHGDFFTEYGHLRNGSITVEAGQEVRCGDVIGQVGSSGCSDGPHVHYGVTALSDTNEPLLYDPYQGPCSPTPTSLWAVQGAYGGAPGSACTCEPNWRCSDDGTARIRCTDGRVEVEPCPAETVCESDMCTESSPGTSGSSGGDTDGDSSSSSDGSASEASSSSDDPSGESASSGGNSSTGSSASSGNSASAGSSGSSGDFGSDVGESASVTAEAGDEGSAFGSGGDDERQAGCACATRRTSPSGERTWWLVLLLWRRSNTGRQPASGRLGWLPMTRARDVRGRHSTMVK